MKRTLKTYPDQGVLALAGYYTKMNGLTDLTFHAVLIYVPRGTKHVLHIFDPQRSDSPLPYFIDQVKTGLFGPHNKSAVFSSSGPQRNMMNCLDLVLKAAAILMEGHDLSKFYPVSVKEVGRKHY